MPHASIGVDIGGTNVKLGLVSPQGKVILRDTFSTRDHPGREALLRKLVTHLELLKKEAKFRRLKLAGVGIGAPGPIDVERGFVYFFPNIPGWKDTPLKKILEKRIHLPVRVDNDANVMAWAEFIFGAGKGCRNMIALTLGTGLGGGIVLEGQLFHGPHFSAAEIGHIVIDPNGPLCGCGNRGCVETFVGNSYFVRDVREHLEAGGKSILQQWVNKEGRELTPQLVQEAARLGDKLSQGQWQKAGAYLGTALAGLVNVLNPERIILGGGMAQKGAPIFGPVRAAIKKKAFPIAGRFVKVLPAVLGPEAGLIGGAALFFSPK